MGFKCAVVGCKTGYTSGPRRASFQFPEKDILRAKWVEFVNRNEDLLSARYRYILSILLLRGDFLITDR